MGGVWGWGGEIGGEVKEEWKLEGAFGKVWIIDADGWRGNSGGYCVAEVTR